MSSALERCLEAAGVGGATIGVIAGAVIGGILTGPLWFLGAIAGAFLGASAGGIAAILACIAFRKGKDDGGDPWSFTKPRFTHARLVARPNPAKVGQPCFVAIEFGVTGNDDRALLDFTWSFDIEAGDPASPATWPVRNNGPQFSRGVHGITEWHEPHDGRLVKAEIMMVAEKNGQKYVVTEEPDSIRVPVEP